MFDTLLGCTKQVADKVFRRKEVVLSFFMPFRGNINFELNICLYAIGREVGYNINE